MKIGIAVDGIATMKEFRMPLHIGVSGSVQVVTKFLAVGLKGSTTHQPCRISPTGRIDVIRTPRNGSNQTNPTPHATAWIAIVRGLTRSRARLQPLTMVASRFGAAARTVALNHEAHNPRAIMPLSSSIRPIVLDAGRGIQI